MASTSKPRTKRAKAKPAVPPPAARTLETTPVEIPVDRIDPSPFQPRQAIAEEAIEDLAFSIATDGLIHPICLRPSPADPERYELVDGERRLRAVRRLGLPTIRAEIGPFTDAQVLRIVVATAVQRAQLNPIEEAIAFRRAIDAGVAAGPTELARQLGLSQGHVSNRLRLLELPEAWQQKVISQEIPPTHARCLVRYKDHPTVLQEIERAIAAEMKYSDSGALPVVERFEGLVSDAAGEATRPIEGDHWDRSLGRRVTVFAPTDEERAALGLVEVPTCNYAGKQTGIEIRATNLKLWDQLQAEHVARLEAKRNKKAGKKGAKDADNATGEKPKELTAEDKKRIAAEERRKAAERERQFHARLYDWQLNWLAYLIGRRLRTEATMQELLTIAMYFAGHPTSYRFQADREMDAALKTQGITSGKPGRIASRSCMYDRLSFLAGTGEFDVEGVVGLMLSAWFWSDDGEPRRLMYDKDLPTLAEYLGIDRTEAWREEQAGPLSEAYWNLHDKQQLVALAGELGVEAGADDKKSDLVALLMDAYVPLPKELAAITKPK